MGVIVFSLGSRLMAAGDTPLRPTLWMAVRLKEKIVGARRLADSEIGRDQQFGSS